MAFESHQTGLGSLLPLISDLLAHQPSVPSVLFLSHTKHVLPHCLCTCCYSRCLKHSSTCLFYVATSLLFPSLSSNAISPARISLTTVHKSPHPHPAPVKSHAEVLDDIPSQRWMMLPHNLWQFCFVFLLAPCLPHGTVNFLQVLV